MMNKLALILSLVFIVGCSSTLTKKQKVAELHYATGTQNLMAQEYTQALTNLLKANELYPNNPGILTNLGMAYYFKGEKETAIKVLNRSIEVDKNNSDSKVNLASIYFREGDIERSEKLYKEVLKDLTYDKQARTLYNLAIIEIERSNYVAAENYLNKSIKENQNYCPATYQLGLLKYNRKEYKKSLALFRDATFGTCYNSAPAHYHQALALIALGEYVEARIKLDEIDTRFKDTEFAQRARQKLIELTKMEQEYPNQGMHATRKIFESHEY